MSLVNQLSTLRAESRALYLTVGTDIDGSNITWAAAGDTSSDDGTVENTQWYVNFTSTGPANSAKGLCTLRASYQEEFDLQGLRDLIIAPIGNSIMEPEPPAASMVVHGYMRDFEFWTTTPIDAQEMRARVASPTPSMPHQEHSFGVGSKGPLCTEEQFLGGNCRTYGKDSTFDALTGFLKLTQACNWSEGELAACPKIYYTRIVFVSGDINNSPPIQFIDIPSRISTMGITTVEPASDISYLTQLQRSIQAPEGV